MFIKNWKQDILTIPNLLSLFRLMLIPVYISMYRHAVDPGQYRMAALVLGISCATDALDGYIARRFDMISILGKFLDPLADKITQLTLILCLRVRHPVLRSVLILFIIKESVQVLMAAFHFHRGQILPGALTVGKICTTVLFLSLIMLVLFPGIGSAAVKAIALVNSFLLLITFLGYLFAFWGEGNLLRDLKAE